MFVFFSSRSNREEKGCTPSTILVAIFAVRIYLALCSWRACLTRFWIHFWAVCGMSWFSLALLLGFFGSVSVYFLRVSARRHLNSLHIFLLFWICFGSVWVTFFLQVFFYPARRPPVSFSISTSSFFSWAKSPIDRLPSPDPVRHFPGLRRDPGLRPVAGVLPSNLHNSHKLSPSRPPKRHGKTEGERCVFWGGAIFSPTICKEYWQYFRKNICQPKGSEFPHWGPQEHHRSQMKWCANPYPNFWPKGWHNSLRGWAKGEGVAAGSQRFMDSFIHSLGGIWCCLVAGSEGGRDYRLEIRYT